MRGSVERIVSRQEQQTALEVHTLPSGMKDFTKAGAGQDQLGELRLNREGIQRPQPRLRPVNAPFEPRSFRLAERHRQGGRIPRSSGSARERLRHSVRSRQEPDKAHS
jgi:hypothetical protein